MKLKKEWKYGLKKKNKKLRHNINIFDSKNELRWIFHLNFTFSMNNIINTFFRKISIYIRIIVKMVKKIMKIPELLQLQKFIFKQQKITQSPKKTSWVPQIRDRILWRTKKKNPKDNSMKLKSKVQMNSKKSDFSKKKSV